MTRNLTAALLCLGALSLGACSQPGAMASNGKICTDFKPAAKTVASAAAVDDGAGPLDECTRRWAYSLAPSHDTAEVVAQAVVGACNAQLTRWNRAALGAPTGDSDAASLTTGEPTSPIAEHMGFAQNRALLYLVQARAGACAPPPATNGVPDGLT